MAWLKDRVKEVKKLVQLSARSGKGWLILIIFAVLVFFIYALYREWPTLLSFDWHFRAPYLILVIVLHIAALWTMCLVWHLMIINFTNTRDWKTDYYIYSISLVARRVPTPIWTIGSRFIMYPAEKVSPQILSLITALETGLIGLAGIICYLIFLPFYSFSYQLPWEIILLVNAIIIGLLVIWPNAIVWIINFLFRIFRRATITVKISRKNLLLWLAIYITTWVLDGTALFFIGKVLVDTSIPFGDVMGVSTISAYAAYLSQFLPTSLAIKEVAMSTLFKFWLPLGVGLVISIALRMAMTLIEIINAVVAKKIASTPEKAG